MIVPSIGATRLQPVAGVLPLGDPGEVGVVEAEVAERLLGGQEAGAGLVAGGLGLELGLAGGGPGPGQRDRPLVGGPGQLQG